MSIVTKLSELVNGHQATVDLSANTLDVGGLEVGGTPLSQVEAIAFYTGVISGTATSVNIAANKGGSAGNSILLVFTGSNTISAAISTWNAANLSNQATLTSGDGTQVPGTQNLPLAGGLDPGSSLVGSSATYTNFTPTSATVKGALEGIDAALATAGGSTQKIDKFTLNSTDISNGYVTLSNTPSTAANVILLVEDAGNMFYGDDYSVSGNQLTWTSLGLDGILSSGDNLTILYTI